MLMLCYAIIMLNELFESNSGIPIGSVQKCIDKLLVSLHASYQCMFCLSQVSDTTYKIDTVKEELLNAISRTT